MKLVLGVLVGTALEFYDFAVYSQLGKFVGPSFFPAGNAYAEQLSFWAAYAVAFVVRPLGALLFGGSGRLSRVRVPASSPQAAPQAETRLLPPAAHRHQATAATGTAARPRWCTASC